MKKKLKILLSALYFETKLNSFVSNIKNRKHIILTFHRVYSNSENFNIYDTCPNIKVTIFEQLLQYVNKSFKIVSLSEIHKNLNSKTPMAAITFDDGWVDNYKNAYPILKKMNLPATIFVTTSKIGSDVPFWQQQIGKCIFEKKYSSLNKKIKDEFSIYSEEQLNYSNYVDIVKELKNYNFAYVQKKVNCFKKNEYSKRLFLSENEIAEMSKNKIDFGSHTVNHVILTNETESNIKFELSESKEKLEKIVNKEVNTIAYPNGNYSEKITEIAELCGYQYGYTTEDRYLTINDRNLAIPRFDTDCKQLADNKGDFNKYIFLWIIK